MKISLKWLNDYIDVSDFLDDPNKLATILTNKGLEVEAVENRAKDFQNVIVGHILEKGQHPNADRLTLCQVATGAGVVHQIVCGARNHNQGDRVVVALPGAVLPGNFEIKLSKIRNVESQGMLCSESELALKEESEGILILPADAPIGKPFAEYVGLDDIVIEIKVTPNRADCLSHYGLARELSCVLSRPLKKDFTNKIKVSERSTKKKIALDVDNSELCPRYTGRFISGVKVGDSPSWMKQRLEACGMKSINNIVDVTNYVMLELGQPLHAFDAREIKGDGIIVNLAKPQEKFTTLDATELILKGTELLIRDKTRAVALAGVVGGLNSGIQESTTEVFVESAFFTPETVRKTSRLHGINTESGYRFSRRVDPSMTLVASNRACELIQELAGGEIFDDPQDTNPSPIQKSSIQIGLLEITERLGFECKKDDFENWMKRLGCQLKEISDGFYQVEAPLFRGDIQIKEDLVEEFARLHGYEHIPEKLPATGMMPAQHVQSYTLNQRLTQFLRREGFCEAFNYAFVDEKGFSNFIGDRIAYSKCGFKLGENAIKIRNPLSEEMNVMRQLLSYGLWKNVLHNFRYGIMYGRIFESNYVFEKKESDYFQNWNLGLISWGQLDQYFSPVRQNSYNFYELKSHIENTLRNLSIKSWSWEKGEAMPEFLHPAQSAILKVEGKIVGFIGHIHPQILESEKVRVPVAIAEMNLEALMQGQPRILKTKSIFKTQQVQRDFAFVMPEELESGKVLTEIQKAGGELLKSVYVFDVFRGAPLLEGTKSVAYRMIYQDKEKTLTDEELQKADKKITDAISQKFSIQVR